MRGVICLLSLLSLSSIAQAHFFASPIASQASDERHIGGIQWSMTRNDVPVDEGHGSIEQTAVTVPWFLSKDDWLYIGGFVALSYDSNSRNIRTASSKSDQDLYGLGAGLQLVAEKKFFDVLTGGASLGYSAALDDARKDDFEIVTQEPIARLILRHEVTSYFVPTAAVEMARPSRRISYKDADNPAEKSNLPVENRYHYYFGFMSEIKGIDLSVAAVLGDRRGFYVTLINKT